MSTSTALALRTLGTLELRAVDDIELSSVLEHNKGTALLLYLVLATPRVSQRRDTLLALLWPELPQGRARVALNKAVHQLRRMLPCDILVRPNEGDLAIRWDQIRCDAVLFEDAAIGTRAEEAMALYAGDLLPGFFVTDAPEFMSWLDARRLNLRQTAVSCAVTLANRYIDSAPAKALEFARRARQLDPVDEGAVRATLTALDRLGDRAAALREYRGFESFSQREYDAAPAPETQALAHAIRRRTSLTPWLAPTALSASAVEDPPHPSTRVTARAAPWRLIARQTRAAAVLAAVFVITLSAYAMARVRRVEPEPEMSRTTVAVMPFRVRGAPEMGFLAEGISTLLTAQLDGTAGLSSVSPQLVLGAIEGLPAGSGRERRVAERFGASLIVTGDVVEEQGRALVSAYLTDISTGKQVAHASADGDMLHVFDLVARVGTALTTTAGLARDEPGAVLQTPTQSPAALRAYLDGERAYRIGSFVSAVQAYQRAVELDTMFGLAYWRLAEAAGWAGEIPLVHPSLNRAALLAPRLSVPIRQHIRALGYYLDGAYEQALPIYRNIAARNPTDAEAWTSIGDVVHHYGASMGMSMAESAPSWRRVLALEPGNAGALLHLLVLAARDGDRVTFERYATMLEAQKLDAARRVEIRALRAFTFGDSAARFAIRRELPLLNDELLSSIYQHVAPVSSDLADLDVVFTTESAARPNQWIGWQLRNTLGIAAGRGQVAVMRVKADSMLAVDRRLGLLEEAAMTSLPFMRLHDARARALVDSLAAAAPVDGRGAALRAYFGGLLSLHFGDTARAEQAVRRLRGIGVQGRDTAVIARLSTLLRADILAQTGRARAARAALGEPRQSPDYANDFPGARERLLRAEVAEQLGDVPEAHRWYATFPREGVGDLPHLAWAFYRDGLLYKRDGDDAAATQRFARARRIMRDADTAAVPFAAELRRRLGW